MKLRIATLSVLSLFVFAAGAYAYGIPGAPSSVNKAVKEVGSTAVLDQLNKDLSKQGCNFKNADTDFETNCNFSKVASTINKHRSAIENVFGKKVRVNITAFGNKDYLANKRARNVRDNLVAQTGMNWWRVNWNGVKGSSNNISFKASK